MKPSRSCSAIFASLAFFAVLSAAPALDLYWGGGSADIAAGTPLSIDSDDLSGTWNATLRNWAVSPDGASYTNWSDGAVLHFGALTNKANAAIALSQNVRFPRITGSQSLSVDYNRAFTISRDGGTGSFSVPEGETSAIVSVAPSDTTRGLVLQAPFTGTGRIVKYGTGKAVLNTASPDFTGTFEVQENSFNTDTAAWKGVTEALVSGRIKQAHSSSRGANDFGYGAWNLGTVDAATADLVSDDLVVTLRGGAFGYTSRSKTRETMGAIVLDTWGCVGHSNSQKGGILTLASEEGGLRRGPLGIGVFQYAAMDGDVPKTAVRIPHGVAKGVTLPWAMTSDSRFCLVDSAQDDLLVPAPTTQAAADLSQWTALYGGSDNIRVGANDEFAVSGALTGDLAVRNLSFLNKKAAVYDLGGHVLCLTDGGLCQRAIKYGANQIVSNGWLTTTSDKLYLSTCDTNAGGDLNIYAAVTGRFDVVVTGKGSSAVFSGPDDNTYQGTTYVSFGPFVCAKTRNAIAIPGDLRILFGGEVRLTGSSSTNQVAPGASIVVEEGATLQGGGQTYTGEITLNGGTFMIPNYTDVFVHPGAAGLHFNGGWFVHNSTARGQFHLGTDVDYAATSTTPAEFRRYNRDTLWLVLRDGDRVFNIADSATLAADVPEMVVDVPIYAATGATAGGSLVKTGAGTLALAETNQYATGTIVREGTLRVMRTQAPALTGLHAHFDNNRLFLEQPVARQLAVRQNLAATRISRNKTDPLQEDSVATTVLRVVDDYELLCDKSYAGVTFDLASEAVDRQGTLGTGPATVKGGTLAMDAGVVLSTEVTVEENGALSASGAAIGSLALAGTLAADLAKGPVAVSGNVSLSEAALTLAEMPEEQWQTVLTYGGTLSGAFAALPKDVSVRYAPGAVLVRKVSGTVLIIR